MENNQQPPQSVPQVVTVQVTEQVRKQNNALEIIAIIVLALLFGSIFMGYAGFSKVLILGFTIYGVVYLCRDYLKNRRLVRQLQAGQQSAPQPLHVPGVPPVQLQSVPVQQLPKTESTTKRVVTIVAISAGTIIFVMFVLPVILFFGLVLFIMIFNGGKSA